ncbi:hypothetical protein CPB85DRAFT_1376179 [Mucidula mucida]|nr:hypothetical protein CPB85DRAFT_1376179 [Mucidula mucida]
MMEVKWRGMNLTAMGVYAPNSPAENRDLWKKIVDVCLEKNLPTPNIIGTDANLVEEEIDRMPQHRDDTAATEALADFKRVFNLHNGWRNMNPTTKGYTYQQSEEQGGMKSRLDRIYVAPEILAMSREWKIEKMSAELTDYDMVSVEITNLHMPTVEEMGMKAIEEIDELERSGMATPTNNCQTIWSWTRKVFLATAKETARKIKPKREEEIVKAEERLDIILNTDHYEEEDDRQKLKADKVEEDQLIAAANFKLFREISSKYWSTINNP